MEARTRRSQFSLSPSELAAPSGVSTALIDLTRRGWTSRPVAMRADITASWSGVAST
jgi:hypothetical protein